MLAAPMSEALRVTPRRKTLNPPKIMRLPSNGIAFGFIIFASRGSFMTLAFTRSRCFFDL